jgi:hypothetical protein
MEITAPTTINITGKKREVTTENVLNVVFIFLVKTAVNCAEKL